MTDDRERHETTGRRAVTRPERRALWWQLLLGVCGLGLLAAGLLRGEYMSTMFKAVRVCLECIGIG